MSDIFSLTSKLIDDSVHGLPRSLQSVIDNEALAYAMYTVENRAIPSMMDGFKPVQRFMIYRALQLANQTSFKKFHKLASIAGGVADLGYHHGESSAQDAGALIANTWNNNCPFLDGQGNFGSRLVQESAASRYIFARISSNFLDIYKDTDIAPANEDKEIIPPKYFLPLIPTVLLNGVSGIATGYATSILPHSLESVIDCTRKALKGELNEQPKVQFPEFRGDIVEYEEGKYEVRGTYELLGKGKLVIKEVPYKWDRAKYVEKVLDKLEEKGFITYDDNCDENGFGFKVKILKGYMLGETEQQRHEKIMKDFGLVERVSQNLVVIDHNGKLRDDFANPAELIREFVSVRLGFISKRIDKKIKDVENKLELASAKVEFIKKVISGEIIIHGKKKKDLIVEVETHEGLKNHADYLVSMSIYLMTQDEITKLEKSVNDLSKELKYWKSTTPEKEYDKDLQNLLK